jgi:hypothetical protein
MTSRVNVWGFAAVAPLVLTLACAGQKLNDVGDVNGSAGSEVSGGSEARGGTGGSENRGGELNGGASSAGKVGTGGYPSCRCSRSEDSFNSRCPRGFDFKITTTVGAQGGNVVLDGGEQLRQSGAAFSAEFRAGAYEQDTEVSITETSEPLPADFVDFSPIFLLESDPAPAALPISLKVPSGNRDGQVGRELGLYTFAVPGDTPVRLSDSYVNAGFLQGSATELGYFFAGYPIEDESVCP